MKQFIICLGITLLLYYIGACLNEEYDPMYWGASVGTVMLSFLILVVWIAPMMLNYLGGEKNFK